MKKLLLIPSTLLLTLFLILTNQSAIAGSATWNLNPTSNDWNTAANWTPMTVPNGASDIATFGPANTTDVSVSTNTTVSSIVFNPGATAFMVTANPGLTLTIGGAGIRNNSGVMQNMIAAVDLSGKQGIIAFTSNATAGRQTAFTNNGAAGGDKRGGETQFYDTSTAGSGTFVSNGAGPGGSFGGRTEFHDSSTASRGLFTANGGGVNGGVTIFFDFSNAGNGTFTTNGGGTGENGGTTEFFNATSAANGTFMVNGSTGGGAFGGGAIEFNDSATADHGIFSVNGATASDRIPAEIIFFDSSTAADGIFTINGGSVTGAGGGSLEFIAQSTASNATITINGGSGGGGYCAFGGEASGGTARFEIFDTGELDIASSLAGGISVGSIEGDGIINLGGNELTTGGNNLSSLFSGLVEGTGGVTKTGTGTLTLSGANTYLQGTLVSDGALVVANSSGSATGGGIVAVNSGTLGGSGIIAGAVIVGDGEGQQAFLAPGVGAGKPTTLTIESALVFEPDGVYTYTFKAKGKKAKTDKVIANGVAISSGANLT